MRCLANIIKKAKPQQSSHMGVAQLWWTALVLASSLASLRCDARAVNVSNTWTMPQEGLNVFYRFFRDRISWFEADAVCQFHHANLVTVDNSFQFDASRDLLRELDVNDIVWIGLMRPQNSDRFMWSNSRPLLADTGYWAESLPLMEAPLCAVIDPIRDYRWHALRCGGPETASFLCEMPVPSWADGCILKDMSNLTMQYMADTASIELIRNCQEDGLLHQSCKGKEDHERIVRELTCPKERLSTKHNIDINNSHFKSLQIINSIRTDNNENNDIDLLPLMPNYGASMAINIEIAPRVTAVPHAKDMPVKRSKPAVTSTALPLEEMMMGDQPALSGEPELLEQHKHDTISEDESDASNEILEHLQHKKRILQQDLRTMPTLTDKWAKTEAPPTASLGTTIASNAIDTTVKEGTTSTMAATTATKTTTASTTAAAAGKTTTSTTTSTLTTGKEDVESTIKAKVSSSSITGATAGAAIEAKPETTSQATEMTTKALTTNAELSTPTITTATAASVAATATAATTTTTMAGVTMTMVETSQTTVPADNNGSEVSEAGEVSEVSDADSESTTLAAWPPLATLVTTQAPATIGHPMHPQQPRNNVIVINGTQHPHSKESADNSHFIPPMLLVKSHYVPPIKHGDHTEHIEHAEHIEHTHMDHATSNEGLYGHKQHELLIDESTPSASQSHANGNANTINTTPLAATTTTTTAPGTAAGVTVTVTAATATVEKEEKQVTEPEVEQPATTQVSGAALSDAPGATEAAAITSASAAATTAKALTSEGAPNEQDGMTAATQPATLPAVGNSTEGLLKSMQSEGAATTATATTTVAATTAAAIVEATSIKSITIGANEMSSSYTTEAVITAAGDASASIAIATPAAASTDNTSNSNSNSSSGSNATVVTTTRRNFLKQETDAPFKPNRRRSLTKPETVSYFKKILG